MYDSCLFVKAPDQDITTVTTIAHGTYRVLKVISVPLKASNQLLGGIYRIKYKRFRDILNVLLI